MRKSLIDALFRHSPPYSGLSGLFGQDSLE